MAESSPQDVVEQVSQTGTPTDTTAQTTTNPDVAPAASSTAEKPAETLLDRVKTTLDKMHGASPASETPSGTAEADPTKAAKPEDEDGLPVDESKALHPKTRERFGKLTSELKAAKTELEKLKPQAEEFGKIETFIRNAGLSSQDVGGSLQIAALLRSDPRQARDRLRPIMDRLDNMLGETLPPELQSRVEQGFLTAEDAKALNRASADAALARSQATETTQRAQQEAQSREQQTAIDSTLNATDTWEKQKAKGDPDWHQKQPEVSELVELAIERKSREQQKVYWPTPEQMVKHLEEAADTVEKRYKRFVPKPRAIDPPVTAGASPRSTPAPKSILDIVKAGSARTS